MKKITKADIAAQTRNLREADGSIKQFIQEDLQNLAEELREYIDPFTGEPVKHNK